MSRRRIDRLQRYGDTTSSPISSFDLVRRPNAGMPPPSINISFPSGYAMKILSPCPTSIAVTSSVPFATSGANAHQSRMASRTNTNAFAAIRHGRAARWAHARPIKAAVKAKASQMGGSGIRQLGSNRACVCTVHFEIASSQDAALAGRDQPVAIATNPTGTATPSAGIMTAFAVRPESDTRWK